MRLINFLQEGRPQKKKLGAKQTSQKNSAKKRRHSETKENIDDFGSDFALLKKLKKGRLKKKEYDELMADNSY